MTTTTARRRDVMTVLAIVVLAMASLLIHVERHTQVSPYDEYMYMDAVAKAGNFEVIKSGEKTGDVARDFLSCHDVLLIGPVGRSGCGGAHPDSLYPYAGKSTADLYSPLYYFTTRAVAAPFQAVGFGFVDAARLASGLWVVLAAALMYVVARLYRVRWELAFAAALVLVGSVPAFWAGTFVSTDAPEMAITLGLLGLGVLHLRSPGRATLVGLISLAAFAGALKIQNLEGVGLAAGLLGLGAMGGVAGAKPRVKAIAKAWLLPFAMLVACTGAQLAWLVVRSLISLGPDADIGLSRPLHPLVDLSRDAMAFFPGAIANSAADPLGIVAALSAWALALACVGGVMAAAGSRGVERDVRALGVLTLVIAILAGPAMSVATVAVTHGYVPPVWRYGIPLIPAFVLCAVCVLEPPAARWRVVVVLAGFAVLLSSFKIAG